MACYCQKIGYGYSADGWLRLHSPRFCAGSPGHPLLIISPLILVSVINNNPLHAPCTFCSLRLILKAMRGCMAELYKESEAERRKAELRKLLDEVELTCEQRDFIKSMIEDDKENGLDEPE